ncbi:PIN domain-containing protein [Natronomonas gomsonensis]|uniref:PIN domain-containing protein n=1 Tax=Natronomonas gomsonensis TaxID=1046043 RepID=UPI00398C48E3
MGKRQPFRAGRKSIDRGQPLGAPDVLIAGIARHHDAELVTADGAFERVSDLSIQNPKADH